MKYSKIDFKIVSINPRVKSSNSRPIDSEIQYGNDYGKTLPLPFTPHILVNN